MRNFSKFLPFLLWAGGLPVAAHALQTVDLPGYESAPAQSAAAPENVTPRYATVSGPWLTELSLDAAMEQGAAFVFVGAVDAATLYSAAGVSATSVDVPALLEDVRLEVQQQAERRGWLGQLVAGLAAVGLVARRRLAAR